jgi:hypothetical protein
MTTARQADLDAAWALAGERKPRRGPRGPQEKTKPRFTASVEDWLKEQNGRERWAKLGL